MEEELVKAIEDIVERFEKRIAVIEEELGVLNARRRELTDESNDLQSRVNALRGVKRERKPSALEGRNDKGTFTCDQCGREFVYKKGLSRHQGSSGHHQRSGFTEPPPVDPKEVPAQAAVKPARRPGSPLPGQPKEKLLFCNDCSEWFPRDALIALMRHTRNAHNRAPRQSEQAPRYTR